jgi:hypothetical protein
MLQTFVFSVWSFATQPENQLKKRGIQQMMQIDFEDVHDGTGWSTEDVLKNLKTFFISVFHTESLNILF